MAYTSRSSGGWHEGRSSATQARDRRDARSESRYNDDDYMAQIEQYKDQPWYDKLLENPWLWSRQGDFSPNLLQQIAQAFGDTSASDNYYNQIRSNQYQWLADTLAQYHQQDYEAAPNQAELTKQAGLNPDLAGIADSLAAENDQPMMPTPPSGFGSEEAISGIANFGINLVTSVMGFAQQIQQFQANSLNNDKSLLGLHNDAMDLVAKELENTINFPDDFDFNDSDKLNEIILDAAGSIDWSPYPKRVRRMMRSYVSGLRKNSATGKEPAKLSVLREELANRFLDARVSRAEKQSHAWYDDDISKMASEIGRITSKYTDEMAELRNKAQKYANRSASVEANVDEQTMDNRINYENQNYTTEAVSKREEELMESMYKEIYEYCGSKESGFLGKIGLLFIPLLRSFVSNMAGASFSFGKKTIAGGTNDRRDVYLH